MSYIKFEHRSLGDERWLDAMPAAFVVHVWALDYCNEQLTDGVISVKVAHRLNCPVEPTELPAAWQNLTDIGLWERTDHSYTCPDFLAHGLAADEQNQTRNKWAEDKRRQRLCRLGNHALCTPRSKCPAAKSTSGQVDESTVDKWTTRPDPTRPDQTPKGSGRGMSQPAANAARCPNPECNMPNGKHVYDCPNVQPPNIAELPIPQQATA